MLKSLNFTQMMLESHLSCRVGNAMMYWCFRKTFLKGWGRKDWAIYIYISVVNNSNPRLMCELWFLLGTLKILYTFPEDDFVCLLFYLRFPKFMKCVDIFVQESLELGKFSWLLPNLHLRISWTLYILKNRYRAFFHS